MLSRYGAEIRSAVPLFLIPGTLPQRGQFLKEEYHVPDLKPGLVADASGLAEPSYTIFHYATPEDRFGYLQAQALRAARLVVDTGLHALGWSRQRAIDQPIEFDGIMRRTRAGTSTHGCRQQRQPPLRKPVCGAKIKGHCLRNIARDGSRQKNGRC